MKKKIVINDKPTVRENNRHFVIFEFKDKKISKFTITLKIV